MTKQLTQREVTQIIFDSFDKDGWGSVDTRYFNPKIVLDEPEGLDDYKGLEDVIKSITDKINSKINNQNI